MPKLLVMYPMPKDMDAFERAYSKDHIPMAAPIFAAAGATKAVLTKLSSSPSGKPAFHRIAEIHFPTAEKLQACAASQPCAPKCVRAADGHAPSCGHSHQCPLAVQVTVGARVQGGQDQAAPRHPEQGAQVSRG